MRRMGCDGILLTGGLIIGVVPVDHPSGPFDCTGRATLDASRPDAQLHTSRRGRILYDTPIRRVRCTNSTHSLSIDAERQGVWLPVDLSMKVNIRCARCAIEDTVTVRTV